MAPRLLFFDVGETLVSADRSRLWIAGNVVPEGPDSPSTLIELRLQPGATPEIHDLPPLLGRPGALARRGDSLLVGGTGGRPHIVALPLRDGALVREK